MISHAALFDLDGVLIDTEPVYTAIWEDIDRQYPTGVENFALKIKGTTLPSILSQYYPEALHEPVKKLLASSEADMSYPIFDGILTFLEHLRQAGVPMAIGTSSGDAKMRRLMDAHPDFAAYFDDVITDTRVKRSKPDPEGYLLAASSLGVAPEHCYVFEDSFNGIRAGRAAGCRVVAVATSNPAYALASLADMVIDSFAGLLPEHLPGFSKP